MATNQPTSGRLVTLSCIVCSTPFTFTPKTKGRYPRFCTEQCKRIRGRKVITTRPCLTCEKQFLPQRVARHNKTKGLYCSLACRPQCASIEPAELAAHERMYAQASRARVKGADMVLHIDDRQIFERDSWTCGICNNPVDRALRFPHHYSACIDHIIPLSRGGQHVPDNLQCAHWLCNSLKGNAMPNETASHELEQTGYTHLR